MPEGHTIHRYARQHTEALAGREFRVDSPQGRFREGASRLDGRTLRRVVPYGKHLWYDFGDPDRGEDLYLHVHLGLYGKFKVGGKEPPEPEGALRVRFIGEDRWLELRGPTACELQTAADRGAVLDRLGPDPLVPGSDGDLARVRIGGSRAAVGKLLMDQTVIAGIGNIYRAEVLFRAGVSPHRAGKSLTDGEWDEVWADTRKLMKNGVRIGRIVTTRPQDRPKESHGADREYSFYVYKRDGKPCRVCGTQIVRAEMAARNVFWCPNCQPE